MRILKFRIWDGKAMHLVQEIDWPVSPAYRGAVTWGDFEKSIPYDEAIIMQFTGLSDKAGVEIYEGDILNIEGIIWRDRKAEPISDSFISRSNRFIVEWSKDDLYYIVRSVFKQVPPRGSGLEYLKQRLCPEMVTGDAVANTCGTVFPIEIIGNIDDNPELLEGNKS